MRLQHVFGFFFFLILAGSGEVWYGSANGRVGRIPARLIGLSEPLAVAVDRVGTLFIADAGAHGIWRMDSDGMASLMGEKKLLLNAGLEGPTGGIDGVQPAGVAVDPNGYLVVASSALDRVDRMNAEGDISLLAGDGKSAFSGDGGSATYASLARPSGIAGDTAGNVFIADTGNNCIRRVDAHRGTISTVSGEGSPGFAGDGGPATSASLMGPQGLAVDSEGNLWIADTGNNRIRRVDSSSGVITTVAGGNGLGFGGDGGPATQASLAAPSAVVIDQEGNLLIADTYNQRVRRIDTSAQIISTVAGNGMSGLSGDGGQATEATLADPRGLALGEDESLYIADSLNHRICRVDPRSGVITTVAGSGSAGPGGTSMVPIADAGPDQILECARSDGAPVQLDGSASYDPEGAPLGFRWSGPFLNQATPVTGMKPQVILPLGKSQVGLVVNNGHLVSHPAQATVVITVRPQPMGGVLADLVPEGDAIPVPGKAMMLGADLPVELRLFCGSRALGVGEVTPPRIVSLAGADGPVPLNLFCKAREKAEAPYLQFQYSQGICVYNLKSATLKRGNYLVTIEMPDGRRFSAAFVLR